MRDYLFLNKGEDISRAFNRFVVGLSYCSRTLYIYLRLYLFISLFAFLFVYLFICLLTVLKGVTKNLFRNVLFSLRFFPFLSSIFPPQPQICIFDVLRAHETRMYGFGKCCDISAKHNLTRNSSGDEIANVNFLYVDIVHALRNTIDSCINSATDRRHYVLLDRFTKFSEITQCNGHYAVEGYSRSPILVPIESSHTTSYYWLILTCLLSYTVSKLWLIIGQIFVSESGVPHFNALAGVIPCRYCHKWYIAKNYILWPTFLPQKVSVYLQHVIRPESYWIRWNYTAVGAITPFKVIQDHRVWYQSKAHIRLPISD